MNSWREQGLLRHFTVKEKEVMNQIEMNHKLNPKRLSAKDWLNEQRERKQKEIGDMLGMCQVSVGKLLRKLDIQSGRSVRARHTTDWTWRQGLENFFLDIEKRIERRIVLLRLART